MKSPEQARLAYLLIASPLPNVYLGGVMVTDGRGLPVEFRYTEPIQPSKIQQILYGQALSQYLKREVIQETLLKSLESRFKCLLVEDDIFLDNAARGYTVLRVSETKAAPLSGGPGSIQNLSATEFLLQTSREGSPIRVQAGPAPMTGATAASASTSGEITVSIPAETGHSGAASVPASDRVAEICKLLTDVGGQMELCEPMRRIERALECLCQEAGLIASHSTAGR
jgi:hypothetical protein